VPPPLLFVVKTSDTTTVPVGATITFYIGYGNSGVSTATSVKLTDVVSGGCLTPAGFTDTVGSLAPGASGTKIVTFVAVAPGSCTNTVTLSAANATSATDSVTFQVVP
jgi:uncharacterized repeat protein (TIGR01451 family)